ncbi:PIN domain-containing protein [Desulfococcaceae bacterium HSG8]|nr:PIN domain-containing protein [Desulfococcaceae bacterium HSG8]
MKILLDTSVLLAAMIESHPVHPKAVPWLEKIRNRKYDGFIAGHSIAELYSALTTLPMRPPISPSAARQLIQCNILDIFEVVCLSSQHYAVVIEHLSDLDSVESVMIYDALTLLAALQVNIDRVVTLNQKALLRIYPDLADKIVSP